MNRKIGRSICEIWLYENYGTKEYFHVINCCETVYKVPYLIIAEKLFKHGLEVSDVEEATRYSKSYIKQTRKEIKIATNTYLRSIDFLDSKDSPKWIGRLSFLFV